MASSSSTEAVFMAGGVKRKWLRRSRDEWREVFARHQESGLNAAAFCARESISLSSFRRWRAIVVPASGAGQTHTPPGQAAFVDLGVLNSGGASRFELTLDLGGGLVLHLMRG
jgi:hypothetical protein